MMSCMTCQHAHALNTLIIFKAAGRTTKNQSEYPNKMYTMSFARLEHSKLKALRIATVDTKLLGKH